MNRAKARRVTEPLRWGHGAEPHAYLHHLCLTGGAMPNFFHLISLDLLLDHGYFRINVLLIKCLNVCHRSLVERSPSSLQGIARCGMKPREGTGKVPDAETEDTYKRICLHPLGKILFKPLPLRKCKNKTQYYLRANLFIISPTRQFKKKKSWMYVWIFK